MAVAADLLALTLLRPPGEMGADVAVGSAQRFGVPLGFGGPHAGFMSVRAGLERQPAGPAGRGLASTPTGAPAYRLALQTREQHIRREKATSNICTAQVLLAVIASMYAVYHGPDGLATIAARTHRYAAVLAAGLRAGGVEVVHDGFFDTVQAYVPGRAEQVVAAARARGVNLRLVDADTVGISTDETTEAEHLSRVWGAFGVHGADVDLAALDAATPDALPASLLRTSPYLTHPVFHAHRSETSMLRYLRRLADRDFALDRGMIPLGSCTMKLNATTEMEPITWPEFADLHPFAPLDQAAGTLELIHQLERWLVELTGYDAVSLQPNAGSQGEFSGLLAIRAYHRANGQGERDVCLIPSSAHGTNAASAVMAGLRVVVVACDEHGNVDVDDLRAKIAEHGDRLAALMVTYPSTHGVFEETITELCALVHDAGGQVYVDGANLNALVGLAKPGRFGADVTHLNLHKTFCIPHGGGGPGVGPVAVRAHLAPYLPNHPLVPEAGPATGVGAVASAPWGSARILPISWAYIRLMGGDGLTAATGAAVLSANYVAARLGAALPGAVHRPRRAGGARVHPRPAADHQGDRRDRRRRGQAADRLRVPRADHVLPGGRHAHGRAHRVARTCTSWTGSATRCSPSARRSTGSARGSGRWRTTRCAGRRTRRRRWPREWDHPYSREVAAFPLASLRRDKYWSPVRRIDGAYGDRHLVCACPPPEAFDIGG